MNELFHVFFVLGVGSWRICSMVANEHGPFYAFEKIRHMAAVLDVKYKAIGEFHLHEAIECEWCNSMYIGTALFIFWLIEGDIVLYALYPFVISAIVIFVKLIIQTLEQIHERLVISNKEKTAIDAHNKF